MGNRKKIEGEELEAIQCMLKAGMSIRDIAEATNRSKSAITNISYRTDYQVEPELTSKWNREKWEFLQENWHFIIPERQPEPVVVKKPAKTKPRTKITPYHYPAMKKYEEDK